MSSKQVQESVEVFHLNNVAQVNDANDVYRDLRDMCSPLTTIHLDSTTDDILVRGSTEQLSLAARLISELDKPKPTYRVTYTLTESDSGKRLGVQHFAMVAVAGQRVVLKQGDKIPLVMGTFDKETPSQQSQITYIDVGMNFETTLDGFGNGLRLRSKVEQSSIAASQNSALAQDPVVRQTVLEGTSVLTPGKPQTLGGIDMVGSTRHVDVEVVAERLP